MNGATGAGAEGPLVYEAWKGSNVSGTPLLSLSLLIPVPSKHNNATGKTFRWRETQKAAGSLWPVALRDDGLGIVRMSMERKWQAAQHRVRRVRLMAWDREQSCDTAHHPGHVASLHRDFRCAELQRHRFQNSPE